ncbi:hypothetical protein AOR_1_1002054 [Paecilomyces variotii No. 5]|uniref:RRM domain-containing protein n=1 Tax=Byssochlamys spectabilis (strain No. 5 / NBRC 109023) TaxID=1356009 RepID=V5FVM5_BYSSN|nr:hypothetical protein AOR_1_1002054 [Paecilomyces variotii No. 5]
MLSPSESRATTPDNIIVLKSEYEDLLRLVREYSNLKASLLNGGLLQETLDVLIEEPCGSTEEATLISENHENRLRHTENSHQSEDSATDLSKIKGSFDIALKFGQNKNTNPSGADGQGSSSDGVTNAQQSSPQSEYRTLVLHELPDRCSHREVAEVIRGGALLEIYLRPRERSASVSFVTATDARNFLDYAQKYKIYILGKRVEVSWNDRQFQVHPYLAAAIGKGASRNILICGVNPNITEALIREQLDHIHNLVVLSVRFYQRNAYISTNSIHNAMYARSCLMSRAIYKGMKICYFQDECARPIHEHLQRTTEQTVRRSENIERSANRYQVLTVDGSYELEEGSDDSVSGPTLLDERLLPMMEPNTTFI